MHFISCTLRELEPMMAEHRKDLSSPYDSFMEEHILNAEHFLIRLNDEEIGYVSIHQRETVTQFYLTRPHWAKAQEVFYQIKRMQFVQSAFVPTCDEFFLAHAVDDYRSIDRQAYFFQDSGCPVPRVGAEVTVRVAVVEEMAVVREHSGNFFGGSDAELERQIREGCIYFAKRGEEIVGFGVYERGKILTECVSIGMYTKPQLRRQGIGRSILLSLKAEARKEGLSPVAGCWYYNHNSKRTLESAGMVSGTRLLKVGY